MPLFKDSRFFSPDDLSIVVFFQRGCAKQIRITRSHRLLLFAGILGLVLIGLISTTMGVLSWQENSRLRQQLLDRSEGLFSYQVRYDQVFEQTYEGLQLSPASLAVPDWIEETPESSDSNADLQLPIFKSGSEEERVERPSH